MGLESATYISGLVPTNPPSNDPKSQGDDHIRLIKSVLQATFPSFDRPFHPHKVLAKTADYIIDITDENAVITVDATGGAFELDLPTLTSAEDGWRITVVKIDASVAQSGHFRSRPRLFCISCKSLFKGLPGYVDRLRTTRHISIEDAIITTKEIRRQTYSSSIRNQS